MDIERTMEFILKQQAKSETQMVGMQKLIRAGMQILAKQGENLNKVTAAQKELTESQKELTESQKELAAAQKDLAAEMKELAKAQRVTETKLQGFIDSLRRGGNGRHSRN